MVLKGRMYMQTWILIGGKRIRDACIYPYKINVAQYYP